MSKKGDKKRDEHIQVFARCRPLNSIEKKQTSQSIIEVDLPRKIVKVKDKNANREFGFDKVFDDKTDQISVYKAVVGPLIQEVLMGYNCTVFAYGQTGTGKTYTMEGERNNLECSWEDDPGAGIIPRSLHQLFEDLNKEENVEFSVRVSFLELYNEELFDLLSSTEFSRLRLFENSSKKGSVIIQGLEEIIVNTKDEVYNILERGTARRQTAATMLNAASSRSHTVFSVTVHIKENTNTGEELLKTGKLNLVDLAGSENVGRSGAVDKRAKEAGSINQSLLTLGRVITALIEKHVHVPYRESKLTRLLQDSLGGPTKTSIIATISPAPWNLDETISTLDYATKAKNIKINPEVNQKMTKRALIREYTEEIERLRKDLDAVRNKDGFHIDMDNYMRLNNEITEKSDLVKHLTDKIECIEEQKLKVEEWFKATREELSITNEKLVETSQKLEDTEKKLSRTANALCSTKKVLIETTLERNEKQYLINVQSNNEKKLAQQAQKLLAVADETTNDVNKLHDKIDRKSMVEKTNEEKCKEFRTMYQKQFAMLDDLVSHSEKQQVINLSRTKEDIDTLVHTIESHQTQVTDFLNQLINFVISNMGELSTSYSLGTESQVEWSKSLIDLVNNKKEILSDKQNAFLSEIIPKFVQELESKNSEMEQWIHNLHQKLSDKIENEKVSLYKKSESRKLLQSTLKESLEAICNNYEEILNDFKTESSTVSTLEEKFIKDFDEKLNDLQIMAKSFQELSQSHKEIKKHSSKCNSSLITSLEDNVLKIKKIQQPLTKLSEAESCIEDDEKTLNEMLTTINTDEFSMKQNSLVNCQNKVVLEIEKFSEEYAEMERKMYLETEAAVKSNLSALSQNGTNFESKIADVKSSVENCIRTEETSINENLSSIQQTLQKTTTNVDSFKEDLKCGTNQLKDEILKRDIEFEKFISDDLLKDIPTGTTPQRKNIIYPKQHELVTTSPHDQILKRLRSKCAADIAVAVEPLNCSFDEVEESNSENVCNPVDVHNASFSSNDSHCYDTDSCASSVSDASVDCGRNKENRKLKESRLPKRVRTKAAFIKPAPPSIRNPLTDTNSDTNEHLDA